MEYYEELPPEKTWYVRYEVEGFKGVQEAGPYTKLEVITHYEDIAGYEGVYHVEAVERK